MPIRTSRTHRLRTLNVLRDNHFSKLTSRYFDRSYIVANTYQEKVVYAGMVVALDSSTEKYVPYNVSASYGTGSDTAVGVLHETYDMTYDERLVEPVWHGVLVENYCYVFGSGSLGSIPAAVKTSLDDIAWV